MNNSARLFALSAFVMSLGLLQGCIQTTKGAKGLQPLMTPAAQACINAAANKYYLPTKVISAVNSSSKKDGSTVIILKVDLRDAKCTINSKGVVAAVVDTSPKSADQIEAEKAAAEGRIL